MIFVLPPLLKEKKTFLDRFFSIDKHDIFTSSQEIILGLQQLITDVYQYPVSISECSKGYTLSFKKDEIKYNVNGYSWLPVKSNIPTLEKKTVYNLEVEIDNSYTANNIVVHNCQGFSAAGKKLNFEDPRSKLFFEYVRLLKEVKPTHFLLENVKMAKAHKDIISEYVGVSPLSLNSSLVSAQNRERMYWTNINEVVYDLFGNTTTGIVKELPDDKGILLQDILENGVVDRGKSYCITASEAKGGSLDNYFNRKRRQLVFVGEADIKGIESLKRVYSKEGLAPTLTTSHSPKVAISDTKYRKLTVKECARLQTIPDWYEFPVSNSQAYKMLGNGFTIEVIKHLLGFINLKKE